ncbi:MAG TPA: HD domain-containing phosphohydrolase [Candidatus Elarobacter sp.]|nr:HD domain-containing phosphohydrolase [Candidatus Elarobacter sp.]
MSGPTIAATVRAHQDELGATLRNRLVRPDAPLVSAAVVDGFVRRAGALDEDGGQDDLAAWVHTMCSSYGDVASLRDVLIELPDALARAVHDVLGRRVRDAELDALAEQVMAIVDVSWRPLQRVRDESLDEVDARIDALIVKLEARDPLTSEHSRAVAAWCSRLGRRLGLDSAEVTFAARCGLLHDVGKIATPLEVLNAPRALDDREWRLIRAHAAAGEAIVRAVPELRPFAPAVRSHHERLDGHGYPDRLPASAIPLMARIVAVADSFNAMIGRRPYRLPMAPVRALEELVRGRETQFDPEVVEAMIDLVERQKT